MEWKSGKKKKNLRQTGDGIKDTVLYLFHIFAPIHLVVNIQVQLRSLNLDERKATH